MPSEREQAAAQFGAVADELGRAAVNFGAVISLSAAFGRSISDFRELERQLTNTNIAAGGTVEEYKAMEKAARDFALVSTTSSAQAAGALYELASAGFTTTESLQAMSGVLLLAQATLEPVGDAADFVANNIRAFNLAASDATRVADVMVASINESQATMSKLSFAFRQVAPVANLVGASIEETTAALNILFNVGLRGEQAGTSLRNSIVRLVKPVGDAKVILDQLRISTTNVDGSLRGLQAIFQDLASKNLSTATLESIFGKEALAGAITLLNASTKSADELGTTWEDMVERISTGGSAFDAANKQLDTLDGSLKLAKNSIDEILTSFGESFAPALRVIADEINSLAIAWRELTPEQQKYYATLTTIIGGITLLGVGLGGLAQIIRITIYPALALLGRGLLFATGPLGLAAAAVATIGLTVAFKEGIPAINDWAKSISGAFGEDSVPKIVDTSGRIRRQIENVNKTFSGQGPAADKDRADAFSAGIKAGNQQLEGYKKQTEEQTQKLEDFKSDLEDLIDKKKELQAVADKAPKGGWDKFSFILFGSEEDIAASKESNKQLAAVTADIKNKQDEIKQITGNLATLGKSGKTIKDSIAKAQTELNAIQEWKGVEDFVTGLAEIITKAGTKDEKATYTPILDKYERDLNTKLNKFALDIKKTQVSATNDFRAKLSLQGVLSQEEAKNNIQALSDDVSKFVESQPGYSSLRSNPDYDRALQLLSGAFIIKDAQGHITEEINPLSAELNRKRAEGFKKLEEGLKDNPQLLAQAARINQKVTSSITGFQGNVGLEGRQAQDQFNASLDNYKSMLDNYTAAINNANKAAFDSLSKSTFGKNIEDNVQQNIQLQLAAIQDAFNAAMNQEESRYREAQVSSRGRSEDLAQEKKNHDKIVEAIKTKRDADTDYTKSAAYNYEIRKQTQQAEIAQWAAVGEANDSLIAGAIVQIKTLQVEAQTSTYQLGQTLIKDTVDILSDSFTNLFLGINQNWRETLRQMAIDILKSQVRSNISKVFGALLQYGIGAATAYFGGGSTASAAGSGSSGASPSDAQVLASVGSARGNVFYGGSLVPFANGGIVSKPTTFPMSGGKTGLMGEAGHEAILPLGRDGNGRLGVRASGGGVNISYTSQINITVEGSSGDSKQDDVYTDKIAKQVGPLIEQKMSDFLVKQQRIGGILNKGVKV